MTAEEAIKLLEPGVKFPDVPHTADDVEEACRMAVAALRAQQTPVNLDRIRWDGCEHCKGDLEGYTTCFRDVNGRSRNIYIPEGESAIVIPGKYNHQFYVPIKYCPFCGRPLTEEAWAELERRIGGNDG